MGEKNKKTMRERDKLRGREEDEGNRNGDLQRTCQVHK